MNKLIFNTRLIMGTVAIAITGMSQGVWAHHPIIEAEAVCAETGGVQINYTATSWQTTGDPGSGNPQIDIRFDGALVDSGAFADPDYSFSGSAATTAPGGSSVVVSAIAVADWDNGFSGGQSSSFSVLIPDDCPVEQIDGRFTGGGHQIRVDNVRVTRGLTIHCDLLLSNNLEINWQGNRFHTEEHLITVECSDDPAIIQDPPPAPLDTLIGIGEGRYNGESGYTIEFVLRDFGEPGREDEASFLVYPNGVPESPVLDVPLQKLTGGNLQAHADQPHN